MTDLKIEYLPIGDIKPYENNAKTHPEEQIEQIKKSIEQLGFNDPIGIWHGEIVEGHGRYEAAKRLGLDNVPIIRLDDLTDEQRRKYALIHNKLTMNSPFDIEVLNVELAELGAEDMGVFGFEIAEPFAELEVPESPSGDAGFNYKEQYGVIVMCKNEVEQEKIYNRLTDEGFDCKVVAT